MTARDGQLDQDAGRWRLRFVRSLPHPPEKVWRALTDPEHLAAWFPADIEGERRAGAPLRFVFRNDEGPTQDGEMLTFDPPSRLEFRWGEDRLHFELEPEAGGCRLTFVNIFDELGKAARDAAGWDVCLDVLAYDLGGGKPPWEPMDRWREVHAGYVDRLGPQAAAIGPPPGILDAEG